MQKITMDTFLTGGEDFEARQYHILQGLKSYYDDFAHSRLYPALSDLIELHAMLEALIHTKRGLEEKLPQRLKEIDLENKKVVYEPIKGGGELERAADLIAWAIPLVRKAIDEGTGIYNFVDEHIAIEEVGLLPMYKEEGYWFVPELRSSLLHLLRYEVSLFTASNERFRTLKTRVLDSLEQLMIHQSPESIKLELIRRYTDLPNPATFICETDLAFPYAETILPVAKRKLMARLFA
jgi:hypothetical protein